MESNAECRALPLAVCACAWPAPGEGAAGARQPAWLRGEQKG